MEARRYALHEMSELEDGVCRASHSAAMTLMLIERFTAGPPAVTAIPLSKDERALLYFAVSEASDYADKAKAAFYKLGEEASDASA